MNYSETYFELDSEEATHCHLICCVYIKGHVEMVDTKDQSNVIVYCICYVICRQCRHIQRKLLGWLPKKVMGRNVWMCSVSTASTYTALNALEILTPSVDNVNMYSI